MAKEVVLDESICYACGACTAVCPTEALVIFGLRLLPLNDRCIACGIAEKVCPTGALSCPGGGSNHESSKEESVEC